MDPMETDFKIVLYTHPDCTYSSAAKHALDAAGTIYHEIDVTVSPDSIEDLVKFTGGERITPVMVSGDARDASPEVTIGFKGGG